MSRSASLLCLLLIGGCSDQQDAPDLDAGSDLQPVVVESDGPTGPRPIQLPADESPHSDPMEWWYYTGRLEDQAGQVYGFELTVFQMIFGDRPLYAGHFAVTDPQSGAFFTSMQVEAEDQRGPGPGFALQVGQLRMQGHLGRHRLSGRMERAGLELTLETEKPAVYQYGTGWMTVGSDKPFYYYSYTRLAASGSLTIDGVRHQVQGSAWMDHQWGTIGTGYGWDWFSLRLDDNSEVMLFKVRREQGEGFTGGTVIDAQGQARELKPGDFETTATGRWLSPHSGIGYPTGWTVRVPSLQLETTLVPMLQDQEFSLSLMGSPIYWEGLCRISGTRAGQPIGGHAYVEITGTSH